MALIDCPDCKKRVSDNAAACPHCGNILQAYNDLNFPGYHIAAVALVVAILTPALPNGTPWWLRIILSAGLALLIAAITWILPAISERLQLRKFQKRGKIKNEKYAPQSNLKTKT
jgi:MFS superfamily sulfate permease-like transporter